MDAHYGLGIKTPWNDDLTDHIKEEKEDIFYFIYQYLDMLMPNADFYVHNIHIYIWHHWRCKEHQRIAVQKYLRLFRLGLYISYNTSSKKYMRTAKPLPIGDDINPYTPQILRKEIKQLKTL